jgi:hypothetical protein
MLLKGPEVLFNNVATRTESGKSWPVWVSYLVLIDSQVLKSCSNVVGLNLKSRT